MKDISQLNYNTLHGIIMAVFITAAFITAGINMADFSKNRQINPAILFPAIFF